MKTYNNMIEMIGNTPLIFLKKASEETGCKIYGKAEFLNPGQSVKDRAALYIIKDAEKRKLIEKGGMIVEGTAGNTGIGLSLVGNALGYKTTIVIPDTQSQEKKDAIMFSGAKLIQVPAVPYKDPKNYIKYSGDLAESLKKELKNGAYWANQFDNTANRQAHIETTGPEIWTQTNGTIDGFICAIGTGGTLSGVGAYLKSKNKDITIGLADPMGANMYSYFKTGELKSEGSSITEGIGQGRVTENIKDMSLDIPFRVSDTEALNILYNLIEEEGLFLGLSSGINIAGAKKLAKSLGKGKTIVTILCDSASRYQNKMFNAGFLEENNLPIPSWL
ncbi:MAG: cysteine synthase A [Alphaproteobacteria bacterium]|nr:cysteine synthase A [Rhodobiaceae bacterium]OUX40163.1 MAG: cysteine synthase A [Rickettsiales bacterium TMED269]|tara:strand:- start:5130 stop:6128 length:999 start_codon:yes stop_codon:yes gene_type:complete